MLKSFRTAVLLLLATGCAAPAANPGQGTGSGAPPASSGPTHITAVVSGAPPLLYNKIADASIAVYLSTNS